jgi:hypothetical protein
MDDLKRTHCSNFLDSASTFDYDIHFQHSWFEAYNRNYTPSKQILYLKDVGCLPLCRTEKRATRFWNRRVLIPLGKGPNDFFTIYAEKGKEEKFGYYLAEWFWNNKNSWEELRITELIDTNKVVPYLNKFLIDRGFDIDIDVTRKNYFINTTQSWEDYNSTFLHKKTRDVRNKRNRIKAKNLNFCVIEITKGIQKHLVPFLELYDKRRIEKKQQNAFNDLKHKQMLMDVIPEYERNGWVKLSLMEGSDGKTWAYQLDFLKDGIQYHYAPVFDPNYTDFSPGKLLLYETIKRAFVNPDIKEFNFMRGESDYKQQFAHEWNNYLSLFVHNQFSIRNRSHKIAGKIIRLRNSILN